MPGMFPRHTTNGPSNLPSVDGLPVMLRRVFLQGAKLFVVCLWASGMILDAQAAEKTRGVIAVGDILAKTREEVRLEARLTQAGMLGGGGLGGEQLEFSVGGIKVGTAMTGGDGRAFRSFTPTMRGNQVIRVRVVGSPRVEDTEATGNLAIWEHRRPIIFVELAALSQEGPRSPDLIPALPFQLGGQSLPPPVAGASKNLDQLTKYYFNVVYLARGGVGLEPLRNWLKEHQFPAGFPMVIKREKRDLDKTIEDFKQKGWDNIKAGIGRTREFAQAFAERRIKVIILSESGKDRNYPRKTRWTTDWVEVRRNVQG